MTTILAFCHALGRETAIPFPSFRLTALVIAQHCKPLSGDGAYPALRTIARKCGLSKSTVHRAVAWMTAAVLDAIRQIGGWSSVCGALEFDLRPGGPIYRKFVAALVVA